MISFIGLIIFIVVSNLLLAQAARIILFEKEQESIKKIIERIEHQISEHPPDWLILKPLSFASNLIDRFFGVKLLNLKLYKFIFAFSLCLATAFIWYNSIVEDERNFLVMPPWAMFDETIRIGKIFNADDNKATYEKTINDNPSLKMTKEEWERVNKHIKDRNIRLLSLDKPYIKNLYVLAVMLSTGFGTTLLSFISFGITRKILREMIYSKGLLTLIGGILVNIVLVFLIYNIILLLVFFISTPLIWYNPMILMVPFLGKGVFWGPVVFSGSLAAIWFITVSWIKDALLVAIFPCLLLIMLYILCALIYSFKTPIRSVILRFIRRSLEWKSGPIAYITGVFLILLALIKFVEQYLLFAS